MAAVASLRLPGAHLPASFRLLAWLPAPVLAWWLTTGVPSCPTPTAPLWAGIVGLVGGLALAAAQDRPWVRRLALSVAVLSAAWLPLARTFTMPGYPHMHDLAVHSWSMWGTARALLAGELWPRWLDTLGVGMPVGTFYPPVPYLLGALPMAAGVPWPTAAMGLAGFSALFGAAGTAWVIRARGGSSLTAGLAAIAFVLAPYRLLDQGYRYAIGELFGLALLLPFWHLATLVASEPQRGRPRLAFVALTGLLVMSHPLTIITGLFGLGVWLLATRPPLKGWIILGLALAWAAAATGVHTVPVVMEQGHTRIAAVVPHSANAYQAPALHVDQPLRRSHWQGLRISHSLAEEERRRAEGKEFREVPHYLGLVLAWPVLMLLWPAGGRRTRQEREALPFAAVCLACLAATWEGVSWVMGHVPIFHPLQFPWRFLGPASVAALPVLAAWVDPVLRDPRGRWAAPLLALALAWDASPAFHAASWNDDTPTGTRHTLVWHPSTCDPEQKLAGYQATPWEQPDTPPAPPTGPLPGDAPITEGPAWAGHPTGDLLHRVHGLLLPPTDLTAPIANVYRAQPEYFTRPIAKRVLPPLKDRDPVATAEAGVTQRFRNYADDQLDLPTWPQVRLRVSDATYGLRAEVRRARPSEVQLLLPEGHPGGQLIWTEQAFPGWTAQVDDAAPVDARVHKGWLATPIPADARRVIFRYGPHTGPRQAGILLSLVALTLFAAEAWRHRSVS